MRLTDRVERIERAVQPCFAERAYLDLKDRYGEAAVQRGYAFVYREILGEAERLGLTVIDDAWGPPLAVEELRASLQGVEWTEMDDRASAAVTKQRDYEQAHKVKQAPAWFLPLRPRTEPHEISALLSLYLIETDAEARRLYLEELAVVEQIAAAHERNDRR